MGNKATYEELEQSVVSLKNENSLLHESDEFYRSIVERSRDGIMIHDKGEILYANSAWAEMHGTTPVNAKGKTLFDFSEPFHKPEVFELISRKNPQELINIAQQRMKRVSEGSDKGRGVTSKLHRRRILDNDPEPIREVLLVREDGILAWVEISGSLIPYKGRNVVLNIVRDSTDRIVSEERLKESEEKYRMLFEHAGFAITLIDAETGRHVEFNRIAHEIKGYSREEFKDITVIDITGDHDLDHFRSTVKEAIDRGGVTFESVHRTKTGEQKDMLLSVIPLKIRGKYFLHNIGTEITDLKKTEAELEKARDELEQRVKERTAELSAANIKLKQEVTEREKTEAELKTYQDQLEELVKERTKALEEAQKTLLQKERLAAIGQLTSTVAHEIRNPLGTIRASVFSITDALNRNEATRLKRAVSLMERNIDRCDSIITELLDYTRKKELHLVKTQVDKWLKSVVEEQYIPDKIKVLYDLKSDAAMLIDKEYLRRAIINIVTNSIQALEDENSSGHELRVETGIANGRLEIGITDNGIGMTKETQDKIFEPLFSTKSFGVGLGMSIVKDIIEEHGGELKITSKAGEGTRITILMPIDKFTA
jgi:PAS domain S-box-containing protein